MKVIISAAIVTLFLLSPTFGKDDVDDKLRQAVQLPKVSFSTHILFSTTHGILLPTSQKQVNDEIALLEKNTKRLASDAQMQSRLAYLYGEVGKHEQAKQASDREVAIYREILKKQPANARAMAQLALALPFTEVNSEKLIRDAIDLEPNDWYLMTSLGRFLSGKAFELLIQGPANAQEILEILASKKRPPETLAKVKQTFDEAIKYFDQAVKVAPKERDAWLWRGMFRFNFGFYRAGLLASEGNEVNALTECFNDEFLADLQELAKLLPEDQRVLAAAVSAEIVGYIAKHPDQFMNCDSIAKLLPEKIRISVEQKMAALDHIAQSKKPESAAAAEIQGILYLTGFRDSKKAIIALRKALDLNPDRDLAANILTVILYIDEDYKSCLEVCVGRVKHNDTPRNRLDTAKLYHRLGRFDLAEKELRNGLKKDENDLLCNLALASVLLCRPDTLNQASLYLDRVGKALQPSMPRQTQIDFYTTKAIFLALSNDPKKGQMYVAEVLKADPENEYAKNVFEAIRVKLLDQP